MGDQSSALPKPPSISQAPTGCKAWQIYEKNPLGLNVEKNLREEICWHYLSYGGACLGHHVPSTFLNNPHSIIQLVTVSVLRAPGTKSFQSQIQKAEGILLLIEYFFLFVLITKHLRHKRKPQALRGEHEHIGCGDSNGVLTWLQGKTQLASQKLP